jgi:NTE family protein
MHRTAIVLGGGGLTGEAFEAGVLSALKDATGFDAREADLIVGTSAGSQIGAGLRFGLAATDLKAFIAKEPLSREGQKIFERIGPIPDLPQPFPRPKVRTPSPRLIGTALRNPWRSRHSWLTTLLPMGSFDLTPYEEVFRNFTGTDWCDADLWVVGARLPMCERVVFGRDEGLECDVPRAVSASCCVPGIFKPIRIGGDLYVDGGVHSATNADLVAGEGFDEVIIVSPMSADRRSVQRGRVNPVRMWCRAVLASEVRKIRRGGAKVTVFQPGHAEQRVMGINALDEARCPQVANIAYDEAMRRLVKTAGRWVREKDLAA